MKKRIIVISLAILAIPIFFGSSCTQREQGTQQEEGQKQEEIQKTLTEGTPLPQIEKSLERENLKARAERLNKSNQIFYVYLMSYGKVVAYYTTKGKVSSLNSYLTPMEQVVDHNGNLCNRYDRDCLVVEAPDVDGSYGENVDGVFFFTTEGAYVEWLGEYLMSDQPLKISTPIELTREVK